MSNQPEEIWVRVNGSAHAVGRELGCPCPRCRTVNLHLAPPPGELAEFAGWDDPPWRANTSASVLFPDRAGQVRSHLLVDVGSGVVDSLVSSGLRGLGNLAGLLITHWHPDHVLGLNQLCVSLRRTARLHEQPFKKPVVYTTRATYRRMRKEGGLAYEFERFLEFQEIRAGEPFEAPHEPPVTITPIGVAHGSIEGAVIFAIDFETRRVVFAWDLDAPGVPQPAGGPANEEVLRAHLSSVRNADLLFIAAPEWQADGAGHANYEQVRDHYLDLIDARRIYLVHLSGHKDEVSRNSDGRPCLDRPGDTGYGWSDGRWEQEVRRDRALRDQPDTIRVARQGMLVRVR